VSGVKSNNKNSSSSACVAARRRGGSVRTASTVTDLGQVALEMDVGIPTDDVEGAVGVASHLHVAENVFVDRRGGCLHSPGVFITSRMYLGEGPGNLILVRGTERTKPCQPDQPSDRDPDRVAGLDGTGPPSHLAPHHKLHVGGVGTSNNKCTVSL